MRKVVVALVVGLLCVGSAGATNKPGPIGPPHKEHNHKTWICHFGQTKNVDYHALKGHLKHGDKLGKCKTTPPGNGGGTPTPTTNPPAPVPQVNRVLACADKAVFRSADGSLGLSGDVTVDVLASGTFQGAKIVIARYYPPDATFKGGATCDNLGGTFTGKYLDGYGYPIWAR